MPNPENSVAALSGPMREEARAALAGRLQRAVMQRRSMQEPSMRAIELTHDAVRGLLESNAAYRTGMAQLWKKTAEEVRRTDAKGRVTASIGDRHLAALEDRAVLHTMGGGGSFTGASPPNHLDVFGPPYADHWSQVELQGAPHARRDAWANAGTGEMGFDYRIFPEAGSIFCGAAVWVSFMRQAPGSPPGQGSPGMVQVRTYTPYEYTWHDQSGMEAAHNDAGFGVYVLSWNLSGGDRVVEQDFSYPAWNDTTDWNWNHGNPSFPDTDSDYALYVTHMAPYFPIRPGRFYSAAIWCFGSGSAAGQATDTRASLTESRVAANVRFVVVDQH